MTTSSTDAYSRELADCPRFTRAEEQELAARMVAGNTEARELLIRSVLPWAFSLAVGYEGRGISREDAIGEANLGVCEAADSFDPFKGRFITWASVHVRKRICRAIADGGLIRLPVYQAGRRGPPSATRLVGNEISSEPEPVTIAEKREAERRVAAAVACLSERDQQLYWLRIQQGLTLKQVGLRLKLCRERIRQLEKQLICRLERLLGLHLTTEGYRRLRRDLSHRIYAPKRRGRSRKT
jgi:RNA polymerase sigma factor (sigma-70 family)